MLGAMPWSQPKWLTYNGSYNVGAESQTYFSYCMLTHADSAQLFLRGLEEHDHVTSLVARPTLLLAKGVHRVVFLLAVNLLSITGDWFTAAAAFLGEEIAETLGTVRLLFA